MTLLRRLSGNIRNWSFSLFFSLFFHFVDFCHVFRFASKEVSLMQVFLCGEKLGVGGCWFMKSNQKF